MRLGRDDEGRDDGGRDSGGRDGGRQQVQGRQHHLQPGLKFTDKLETQLLGEFSNIALIK